MKCQAKGCPWVGRGFGSEGLVVLIPELDTKLFLRRDGICDSAVMLSAIPGDPAC